MVSRFFMKKLNQLEKDVACVARDLFLKGTPEWRVATYAHHKKMTEQQLGNLLDKLNFLPSSVRGTIRNHYKDIAANGCFDLAKGYGEQLETFLKQASA